MKQRLTGECPQGIGEKMYGCIRSLFPICRSITGDGLRETLRHLQKTIPLKLVEIPTGTRVFDWEIPKEWNIRDAYIKTMDGQRVVDFRKHNLHVMNYSQPVNCRLSLDELKPHLHTLPENPDWIPYRTSYYNETWGFCLSHNQLLSLEPGLYDVCIDASLENGSLTYGEFSVKGESDEEILFFTHCCHPSLCNDNLSGIALTVFLAEFLNRHSLRYSLRFVFAPATIGSIAWLNMNRTRLCSIKHGFVVAVVGDSGKMTYKRTRFRTAEVDRAVEHVLEHSSREFDILDFSPWGYDERQFGSPGINLPVGRLTRTPNGCYPQYHTSADDLALVQPDCLADSFDKYLKSVYILDNNASYMNTCPEGEPQLGKRGLYRTTGGHRDVAQRQLAMLWILNMSDGNNSLLDIAIQSKIDFSMVKKTAEELQSCGLLEQISNNTSPDHAV